MLPTRRSLTSQSAPAPIAPRWPGSSAASDTRLEEHDEAPRPSRLFFAAQPVRGWRFIILNTLELSVLGAGTHPLPAATEAETKAYLARCERWAHLSPEDSLGAFLDAFPPHPDPKDAADVGRRLVPRSGACGSTQLTWLRGQLRAARAASERVIVFGHVPTLPSVVNDLSSLCWDYAEILDALRSPDGAACVVAYVAGHDHRGGYARDGINGAHHVTMPSPLEAKPGTGSRFAIATLHANGGLTLRGEGELRVQPMAPEPRPVLDLRRDGGVVLEPPLSLDIR